MSIEIIDHKYKVLRQVGTGGMAHVYKAVHMSTRKTVAIKMLKDEYRNDRELLRRFEREARATLHLNHDNIVRAYGVGEHEGIPYIVLEYVEGPTLKEVIEENGHLSPSQAIGICCQILDALQTAHDCGIIHRDIKPQNVILNSRGKAKLADFGIAREVTASTVTFDGKNIIGSVHYISPEQAKGEMAAEESDIYSVGITLYEMLTGKVPFKGETTVSTALMHIGTAPTPPIELVPSLPPALNDIVLRAIAKSPQERYHSARAMRSDLIRSLSDPGGTFAREIRREEEEEAPKGKKPSVYLWLAVSVFAPLLIILLAYLGFANNWCAGSEDLGTQVQSSLLPSDSPIPSQQVFGDEGAANTEAVLRMPSVLGMRLDDALSKLKEAGVEEIFAGVRYGITGEDIGTVIEQSPSARTLLQEDTVAKLTIGRESHGRYKADVSFTVNIPDNDACVRIVYRTSNDQNIEYSVILYEATLAKQDMFTISATLYSNDAATRTIYLLINGEEVRSQDVKFAE